MFARRTLVEAPMAMVGLFWITEGSVYLGAEPAGTASGLRLTADGVETLGSGHESSWSRAEVRRIEAADVAVRSGARRLRWGGTRWPSW
jgi:hypothetical protein